MPVGKKTKKTKKTKKDKKDKKDTKDKKDKKAYGFLISHFYGSLSNDILAVKGLI